MSTPETVDEAELRALQKRVYGRGAKPTAAELERIDELQRLVQRARADAAAPVSTNTARFDVLSERPGHDGAAAPADQYEPDFDDAADAARDGAPAASGSPDEPGTAASTLVRQAAIPLRLALIGSALLLGGALLGGSIAGLIAQQANQGPPLTAEQLDRREAIYRTSGLDAGSLTIAGISDEVLIWAATAHGGERVCAVLDTGDQHRTSCLDAEVFETVNMLYVSVARIEQDGDVQRMYSIDANLSRALGGQWVAHAFERESEFNEADVLAQFSEQARPSAQRLIDEGFNPWTLQIVGEFEGQLVWLATRDFPAQQCLVTSTGPRTCHDGPTLREGGLRLVIITAIPGGPPVTQELVLNYSNWGWPYLSVRTLGTSNPSGFTMN